LRSVIRAKTTEAKTAAAKTTAVKTTAVKTTAVKTTAAKTTERELRRRIGANSMLPGAANAPRRLPLERKMEPYGLTYEAKCDAAVA